MSISELTRFGVSMEPVLLKEFDKFISDKGYKNRSEAIRDMIRKDLVENEWRDGKENAVGTITIVYNHHKWRLSDKLTEIQHRYHSFVVSTLHVHLDHDNCLEVLVLRAKSGEIQTIADLLTSTKGVKHCKLMITASDNNLL